MSSPFSPVTMSATQWTPEHAIRCVFNRLVHRFQLTGVIRTPSALPMCTTALRIDEVELGATRLPEDCEDKDELIKIARVVWTAVSQLRAQLLAARSRTRQTMKKKTRLNDLSQRGAKRKRR